MMVLLMNLLIYEEQNIRNLLQLAVYDAKQKKLHFRLSPITASYKLLKNSIDSILAIHYSNRCVVWRVLKV